MNRELASAVLGNRSLARIELAFAAFNLADWVRWLAIVVFAFDRGGAAEAGIVTLLQSVPSALVAPFGANIGDRFSRPTMLRLGYTCQAILLALTAAAALATDSAALVYLFSTIGAMASSLIRPANRSLLPEITKTPTELTAANVLSSWVEGLGGMTGPILSGVLVDLSSPGVVIGLAAALVTASASLVLRLETATVAVPAVSTPAEPDPGRSAGAPDVARRERSIFGGFVALRRRAAPRMIVIAFTAASLLAGAINVLYVSLALEALGTGASGAGTLGSALGLGYLIGAALSTVLVGRPRLSGAAAIGFLLGGLPLLLIAASPSVVVAIGCMVIVGVGHAIYDVAAMSLLQRVSPERVLSRIFGIVESGYLAAFGIGSAVIAWLIVVVRPLPAITLAGLWMPIVVLVVWRGLRAVDNRASVIAAEHIELLRSLPMFKPLRPVTLERLARGLWRVHFEAGAVILRQGDFGDAFYVVKSGRVRYEIDGQVVGEDGPGAEFGEVALLRNVPRTATVIAVTPVQAFALGRRQFLEAMTGSRAHAAAEEVATARLG
ncbi:MAG TPA: MFS transporter [Candidatus Limnocylindrales bacterium]|nr:MFS transporter [Candidatus Limnocylindrales bacterium]